MGEGVSVEPQTVEQDDYATEPVRPLREDFIFRGWFSDNDAFFFNEWNFKTDIVTQDTILYAKWKKDTLQDHILSGTKWKLIGVVDVQTGNLIELEPKNNSSYYTIEFNTDSYFTGQTTFNMIICRYEIDYEGGIFYITSLGGTEAGEVGDGYSYRQILMKIRSFAFNDTYPRILNLYYDNGENYLKYKEIGD